MVFTGHTGCGVTIFKPAANSRMTRCVVSDCGSLGVNMVGSATGNTSPPTFTARNDFVVEDSYFARCNTADHASADFGTKQAGLKAHDMVGITVRRCIAEDINPTLGVNGFGAGFWFDSAGGGGNIDVTVHSTLVRRCARAGIFPEIAFGVTIANCLVYDCGRSSANHANVRIAARDLYMWHVTSADSDTYPLEMYDNGHGLSDAVMANNLYTGPGGFSYEGYFYSLTAVSPDTFFASPGRWGKNGWWKNGSSNIVRIANAATNNGQFSTPAALNTAHPTMAGTDLLIASDPYVNAAGNNFRVANASAAHNAGEALPSDIAALIGKTAGQSYDLGYIDVPIPSWA